MNNYFINIIRGLNLKSSIKCATKVLNSIVSKFDDHVSIKKIKEFFQDITSVTLLHAPMLHLRKNQVPGFY